MWFDFHCLSWLHVSSPGRQVSLQGLPQVTDCSPYLYLCMFLSQELQVFSECIHYMEPIKVINQAPLNFLISLLPEPIYHHLTWGSWVQLCS